MNTREETDRTVLEVARLMALSARTAPKGAGQDHVEIVVLDREATRGLGASMTAYGREKGIKGFVRDGGNLEGSSACILVGLREHSGLGLDCGACGHACGDFRTEQGAEFRGPQCELRVLDMGIALGSAVKTASLHNVDNRIMYRAGAQALRDGLIEANFVMGIPLSASGKSPYFDR